MTNKQETRYAWLQGQNGKFALALLALSLVVRLVPAYFVYCSFDVGAWELVIRQFRVGKDPYLTGKLNWPPLWPALLFYIMRLEEAYDIPGHFAVKLIPCIADSVIALVIYAWFLRINQNPRTAFMRSLWYALNPVAIATCALQGQFESLPSLFTLLAILAAMRARQGAFPASSALWLGMAGFAKTWPLFLTPVFLRATKKRSRQIAFVALAAAPAVLSVGALYLHAPVAILKNVINYRSRAGMWGLTTINLLLPPGAGEVWTRILFWILCSAWLIVYILTWRRGSVGQTACLGILTFYVFTPGCGPQYYAWILAMAVLFDFPRMRTFTFLTSILLTLMYVYSPFNGEYFDFVRHVHTDKFWATNMNAHHVRTEALLLLPLWCFCIWWWWSLLQDVLRQPARQNDLIPDADSAADDQRRDNTPSSNGLEDAVPRQVLPD